MATRMTTKTGDTIHFDITGFMESIDCQKVDGKQLYIESKKGKNDKKGQESPLMREAIGQLMTGCKVTENMIAIVAVPYSEKSYNLASKWAKFEKMQLVGIKFYLVKEDGDIVIL